MCAEPRRRGYLLEYPGLLLAGFLSAWVAMRDDLYAQRAAVVVQRQELLVSRAVAPAYRRFAPVAQPVHGLSTGMLSQVFLAKHLPDLVRPTLSERAARDPSLRRCLLPLEAGHCVLAHPSIARFEALKADRRRWAVKSRGSGWPHAKSPPSSGP